MWLFGGLWHDRLLELIGHCMQSSLYLCVLTYTRLRWKHRWTISINLSQWKELQLWPCDCTMTTTVTAGICLPPRGTHFRSPHPLIVSPVSKSLRDQCAFTPVLMFIFSSRALAPGVSQGGWKVGGSEGRNLNVCVCVCVSLLQWLPLPLSVFWVWTQTDQITDHCTPPHQDIVFLFIFDSKAPSTWKLFWLGFCLVFLLLFFSHCSFQ